MTNIEPIAVPIPEALRLSGMGRTKLYEEIGSGRIAARKCGKRTLVEVQSLRSYLNGLPAYEPGPRAA